jgi:acetyl esterase/lipase
MDRQSLQSYFFRFIVKHVVGPKFRRAGRSISKYRKLNELIIKNQKIPKNTEIWPVQVKGIAAEWVRAPNIKTDSAILYLHGGAFIMGSPATHRELAARLSASTNAMILVIEVAG